METFTPVCSVNPTAQRDQIDTRSGLPFSSPAELALKAAQVRRLLNEPHPPGKNKIIWLAWGAKPGDNKAYRAASVEYNRIIETGGSV